MNQGNCGPFNEALKVVIETKQEVVAFGFVDGLPATLLRHIETEVLSFIQYFPGSPHDVACVMFLVGGVPT